MILQDKCCDKCGKEYTFGENKWCKPCQMNYLEKNFANWTSGNEEVDNLIREMQLKIKDCDDYEHIIFEWIPYDQFSEIEEIGQGGFAKVYSAIWKDGPLHFDYHYDDGLTRQSNKKVALKCLYNSQNITNEFLKEV